MNKRDAIAKEKRAAKFARSDEYYEAGKRAYPFGFDEDNGSDAEREKIDILNGRRIALKEKFLGLEKAANERFDADHHNPENERAFHAYASGHDNAVDTVAEGVFEYDSVAFWNVALASAEEYFNNN